MKKISIIVVLLTVLVFCPSCKKNGQTETTALPLPETGTADYGTEWAYAPLDSQVPADDPDFSVTGRGF